MQIIDQVGNHVRHPVVQRQFDSSRILYAIFKILKRDVYGNHECDPLCAIIVMIENYSPQYSSCEPKLEICHGQPVATGMNKYLEISLSGAKHRGRSRFNPT